MAIQAEIGDWNTIQLKSKNVVAPEVDKEAVWQNSDDLRWAAKHWAVRIGVKVAAIQIRPMSTKWASMSRAGRMSIDVGLLEIPRYLGEFVLVHELVHLLVANHGKVFKSFMYAYMPDWEEREQALRCYVNVLEAPGQGRR